MNGVFLGLAESVEVVDVERRDMLPGCAHFFTRRAQVTRDGVRGEVIEHGQLYAVVRWADGREEEIEQHDPTVWLLPKAVS